MIEGSSPNQATDPRVIAAIFFRIEIMPNDILVDLGCGDGDIIAHWIGLSRENRIIGIERDAATATRARYRFAANKNVEIICGDASLAHPDGTLFYMFNPFRGEQMRRMERLLRNRDIRLIYNATHDLEIFGAWKLQQIIPLPHEYQFRAALLTPPHS